MLRTNLATRPFYNERAVHFGLAIAAALVVAVTVFNVTALVRLTKEDAQLSAQALRAETRAAGLRRAALALRRSVNPKDLEAVSLAAREANTIIDQRTFSWTELFNRFETTLPPEMRIASVAPSVDRDGRMRVTVLVVARRVEDIDTFMEELEGTGAFADLLSRQEFVNQEGLIEASLDALYEREGQKVVGRRQ